jgi:ABC-type antimicrobial peptide transport system permease subunit
MGKSLSLGPGAPYEIVGVAKDTSYNSLSNKSEPLVYVSLYQRGAESVSLIVRTSVEPKSLVATMQREIKELGGNLPIFDFKTLDVLAKDHLLPVKAAAGLLGLLSAIGVLVAAIGIYGVTSYAFNQRRKEIGIRLSLGAQRVDILKLIMKEGVSLAVMGIIIGVLLAVLATYVISSFVFGIAPVNPLVIVLVSGMLALVAVGSSLAPAFLAANSDPVEALRHE